MDEPECCRKAEYRLPSLAPLVILSASEGSDALDTETFVGTQDDKASRGSLPCTYNSNRCGIPPSH